jgi:Tfp pilus assembly protein PilX
MKTRTFSKMHRSKRQRRQQGITLVTTLLLLLLLVGMSLTMVLAVSSESLINNYYGRYRGSFYAADSGIAAARQVIMTQLKNQFPTSYTSAAAPVAPGNVATVASQAQTNTGNAFSGGTNGYQTVNSSNSWQESFKVTNISVTPSNLTTPCQVTGGLKGATCANPLQSTSSPVTAYTYNFAYSFTVVGKSQGSEVATITDSGTIVVNAPTTGPSYNQSFAAWGMFIGTQSPCSSGDLVPGTITGPVFTNGGWTFGASGPYTFTDNVGQSGGAAGWDNGSCKTSATATNGISPAFNGPSGFLVNQPAVPLPQNSFNQEQAVLDGIGNSGTQPNSSQLAAALKDVNGKAYAGANGVFLPYSTDSSGNKTFNGGGIFVEGAASVVLSPGSNNSAQVFTITQTSPKTVVTVVTVDPNAGSAGTTTISSGPSATSQSAPTTITGVPQQFSAPNVSEGPATMLFVDGAINSLSGPGQGIPAIQTGSAVTVVASGSNNITITGDILYKAEPVTLTATKTTPIDTLIPANDSGQVLGIFTSSGNIQLANSQGNGNLEIDASIAAISQTGSGGLVNTGAAIKTLTIVGGRIQNTIQNINATTRNVLFDRRFANGFAPPWFPSTTVTPGPGTGMVVTANWKGTQWLNQTNYQ